MPEPRVIYEPKAGSPIALDGMDVPSLAATQSASAMVLLEPRSKRRDTGGVAMAD